MRKQYGNRDLFFRSSTLSIPSLGGPEISKAIYSKAVDRWGGLVNNFRSKPVHRNLPCGSLRVAFPKRTKFPRSCVRVRSKTVCRIKDVRCGSTTDEENYSGSCVCLINSSKENSLNIAMFFYRCAELPVRLKSLALHSEKVKATRRDFFVYSQFQRGASRTLCG